MTLEDKQEEKNRLWRKYRRAKRAQWKQACQDEPRLAGLRRQIRRTVQPASLLALLADSWARVAPLPLRYAILEQIDNHAQRMARRQGRAVLDDPIPPATNVFFTARELLGVR